MDAAIHAAIAASHAADRNRKRQEEEERMTRYNSEELESDWEFKIVRSSTPIFRKPEVLQRVRDEEALAGWILLEKLDNNRVRFKRPASAAKQDTQLPAGIDPYRTQIGDSGAAPALILAVVSVLILAFGVFLFSRLMPSDEPTPWMTLIVNAVVMFLILLVPITLTFILLRSRS